MSAAHMFAFRRHRRRQSIDQPMSAVMQQVVQLERLRHPENVALDKTLLIENTQRPALFRGHSTQLMKASGYTTANKSVKEVNRD